MATDRRSGRRWADFPLAIAMLLPSAVILGVFVVYPLGRAMVLGQQRCDNFGNNCVSNGLDQYVDLFRSIEFQNALGVTFRFALITVPLGVGAGIGFAVLADKYLPRIGSFRTVFSSTVATSVAVASLMWLFLLQPSVGALANMEWFSSIFPSVKDPGWLQDPGTALVAVGLSSVWANLGFTFILVTAGLQSIPRSLIEAAAIDGAGPMRRFWTIVFPLLTPTAFFLLVVNVTYAFFDTFAIVDAATSGGPGRATEILVYKVYVDGFKGLDLGGSAAQSVILMAIVIALTFVQFRYIERKVNY